MEDSDELQEERRANAVLVPGRGLRRRHARPMTTQHHTQPDDTVMPYAFYTIGCNSWAINKRAAMLVATLRSAGVEMLIDIRHSPCSSQTVAGNYGPKPWTLQVGVPASARWWPRPGSA